ncbi:hypothetical protein [Bacillus cereus]|uniref:Phage protein n=1 Tax=Bacillus cereus TIAC219 TaxID=718222 RepID=A0ABC9SQJ1_BACCE|nr:hypothetical protein [Bacillus cereus]EJP81141.1 hypothetical protein IC1_06629 [Bacillus cereus VD022]EOQ57830.1 hypothetical protein IAY_06256 [Bacillus cereus TIAC219]
MIKGQPKIGDKVVIRWNSEDEYESYNERGRNDMDVCEIVTDGKRVYLRGYSVYTGNVMRAFKAAYHKTVESLFTAMGEYMHDGVIKSFHVRRKTNDRLARQFDIADRSLDSQDVAFAYENTKRKYK